MKNYGLLLLGALVLGSCSRAQVAQTSGSGASAGLNKNLLLRLVNEARAKGCRCGDTQYGPAAPLAWNPLLEASAAAHSRDMAQNHYFSHTAPDGSGAGERIQRAGYNWKTYGENIAQGYRSEEEAVKGWLGSPGHCRNIMNPQFTELGAGRAGNYWTQNFGSR